ncbi:hypothetical protein GCM10018781_32110 [Kitasatospora indigofera]|uniref:Uncharacterized protein n=1 Tax=Kitasatospora indigofera TaxID=67307 RepID=A0A919FRQ2_9ACTN|nr:hypothetical protein GCM10018781_32110 [Kitasatospora indigofera]
MAEQFITKEQSSVDARNRNRMGVSPYSEWLSMRHLRRSQRLVRRTGIGLAQFAQGERDFSWHWGGGRVPRMGSGVAGETGRPGNGPTGETGRRVGKYGGS